MNKEDYKNLSPKQLGSKFINFCKIGDIEQAKFLLDSSNFREYKSIYADIAEVVLQVINEEQFDIVKNFMNALSHKEKLKIRLYNNLALNQAIAKEKINIVKYLLTAREIKNYVFIHENNDEAFVIACSKGNLEVVEYLTSSPEINDHIDINKNHDNFINACEKNHQDIVKYCIFNLNIQKNDEIELYLEDGLSSSIEKMFEIRELNKDLIIELNNDVSNNKMKKLKL